MSTEEEKGKIWLLNTWPIMTKCDHDWTMERYDFPQCARTYIKNNWLKVGNQNGGVYEKITKKKKTTDTLPSS